MLPTGSMTPTGPIIPIGEFENIESQESPSLLPSILFQSLKVAWIIWFMSG
ncbi:hypothetical protein [Clostridium sp. 3-3]|uniref:hypothetical protein n=1 Tax=Clostridium sp. 3-3 TaxID=2070757 RepID=UPI001A9A4CAA|nr:hypothetical protein [Clostridium sp. 3-3]